LLLLVQPAVHLRDLLLDRSIRPTAHVVQLWQQRQPEGTRDSEACVQVGTEAHAQVDPH
jgi:hypothetical protein